MIVTAAAVWLALWFAAGSSYAHSSLTDASPAPDSRLAAAPQEIVLTFNERVEDKGYAVQIYNDQGRPVSQEKAVLDSGRRSLRLPLPQLADGSYTVTYRLLSADGHPIRASYVFAVGEASESRLGYASASRLHEEHDLAQNMPYWIVRGLYFAGLLSVTGWLGLQVYAPGAVARDPLRYRRVAKLLIGFHLAALLLLAWSDFGKLSEGLAQESLKDMLLGTSIGLSYALALPFALAGWLTIGRGRVVITVWIIAVFAAKGLNGHAMGFAVPSVTYALDIAHLAAASVWAGVLLAFAIIGPKRLAENPHAAESGPAADGKTAPALQLSRAALFAIAVLSVTGVATAALYTNGFHRLPESQWGQLMLAKTAAVLLVLATGAAIRRTLRKRTFRRKSPWLLFDLGLLAAIVGITAILTYLNPLAVSGPLFWHENVKGLHIAAIITPNKAGENNQFNVSIGGGGQGGGTKSTAAAPRSVTLRLESADRPDIAPIDVPLKSVPSNGSPASLYDFHYSSEGSYLSLPGKWRLEVRVLDGKLNEFTTSTVFYSEPKK
ncbi:copper resistance CopC/CopD family protein [Paenibacillus sp. NPDC058071]|uniref:copper resistance CopC/CopD family protein n=1 Tax=Paenibacillus sp. NPDC058071 TaxID=3346326 RepID=UPI0036D8FA5C